jgi:outer membrane protein assembly factor BamE (lipoprotein component of BamABCDE complex)
MNKTLLLLLALALSSCATSPTKFKYLSVGMTKQEVMSLLGEPYSVSAKEQTEYLNYVYNLGPISGMPAPGGAEDYFVRLKQGRVDAYGKAGDFDSTKDPTTNVNVNVNERAPTSK